MGEGGFPSSLAAVVAAAVVAIFGFAAFIAMVVLRVI
jgi:hypothetical protein